MTLQTIFEDLDKYGTSYGEGWVQYIEDHFSIIRDKATYVEISLDNMYRYKYRPEDFLQLKGIDVSLSWIMLLINQIPDKSEFNNIPSILIPSEAYIQQLQEAFDSINVAEGQVVDLTSN